MQNLVTSGMAGFERSIYLPAIIKKEMSKTGKRNVS